MKTKLVILVLIIAVFHAWPACADWPVIDTARLEQARVQHKQNIHSLKQLQERQDQQIMIMTQQLAQLTFIAQVLGDPLTNTTLAGGQSVIQCLAETGVDRSRSDIIGMTQAALALAQDALGLYRAVGESFQTFDGKSVSRDENAYRGFAALSGVASNYDAVATNVKERRERLRAAIRETMLKLAEASPSTEVQKLQAVMSAQFAELEAADKELDFATSKALMQDIENRNDELKQAVARREEQAAEMEISADRMRQALRPNTEPLRLRK